MASRMLRRIIYAVIGAIPAPAAPPAAAPCRPSPDSGGRHEDGCTCHSAGAPAAETPAELPAGAAEAGRRGERLTDGGRRPHTPRTGTRDTRRRS
jgi:hypothetical protein